MPEIAEPRETFYGSRQKLFDALSKKRDGANGLVETTELTAPLCTLVRDYAKRYGELLEAAAERYSPVTSELLEIDTLALDFGRNDSRRATLLLPTHPLRLLWYGPVTTIGTENTNKVGNIVCLRSGIPSWIVIRCCMQLRYGQRHLVWRLV
jgi:hypothetical protein